MNEIGTHSLAMSRGLAVKVVVVGLALLLVCAWIDGGREPLHEIVKPVTVPGGAS